MVELEVAQSWRIMKDTLIEGPLWDQGENWYHKNSQEFIRTTTAKTPGNSGEGS